MHRTEGANNSSNRFTDGPPGTNVEQDWLNAIQDEIVNVIETAGLTLKIAETETGTQLSEALNVSYVTSDEGNGDINNIGGVLCTGGETSPDATAGGLCLNQTGAGALVFTTKDPAVDHGMTDFAETDTYFALGIEHPTRGGAAFWGFNDSAGVSSLIFRGITSSTDTTTSSSNNSIIELHASKKDGTGQQSLADNDNALSICNENLAKLLFKGNGDTYIGGGLYTGAEFEPDVDTGGICINHGANDGNALTLKNSDVAHGMTLSAETDTYFLIKKVEASEGGAHIRAFTETINAMEINGLATTVDNTESPSSVGTITLRSDKKDGTNRQALGADDNILTAQNLGTTVFILKGNGDIYTDADQTGGLTGTYDAEDDLQLCEALKYSIAGWEDKVITEYKDRLQELGIMSGTFWSDKKVKALMLGTIGQIHNILKGLAKKLDISKEELFEMAKSY